jgi:hypothetical protein
MADQRSGEPNISRYPMHRMVAVLDDAADVRAALDGLMGLGVESSDVVVLTGEEGVARLDPSGEGHGLLGRLLRVLQLTAEEGNALEFHHQALAAGKSVVYVKVHGDARKDAVAAALTAAGGHHLAYFGRWTVEKQQG